MKLRLNDLEAARRNPIAYRQGVDLPRAFRGGMSRSRALQLAIYEFHRRGDDLAKSRIYLDALYQKHFKRQDRLRQLEEQLESYAAMYRVQGNVLVETMVRVAINVGSSLEVSGQIPRLDLTSTGYAFWLFAKVPGDWRDELRMPLLQAHFARRMGADLDQVTAGIFALETAEYVSECYSTSDVNRAQQEVAELAAALTAPELNS